MTVPRVGMNDTVRLHSVADNGLQVLPGKFRHDLSVDLATAFTDAKYRGFTIGATATISPYTPGPE